MENKNLSFSFRYQVIVLSVEGLNISLNFPNTAEEKIPQQISRERVKISGKLKFLPTKWKV